MWEHLDQYAALACYCGGGDQGRWGGRLSGRVRGAQGTARITAPLVLTLLQRAATGTLAGSVPPNRTYLGRKRAPRRDKVRVLLEVQAQAPLGVHDSLTVSPKSVYIPKPCM